MIITLIGYRGSGKSTVAAGLASRLGWAAVDADEQIERAAGKSIRQIFAEGGEPQFRDIERRVIAELLQRDRIVLSAGGGAVLNPETRREMSTAGPVVWLRASVGTLQRRIAVDTTTAERRPNLTAAGVAGEVAELLARRAPLYREIATLIVETDELNPEQIVDQIWREIGPIAGENDRGRD